MSEPLFLPASFFIFRAPTTPVSNCLSYENSDNWVKEIFHYFHSDNLFREAILVASPSLYQAMQKKEIKEPEKTANSLLYYALRMSHRATPFGLFSFVATGHWSNQTKIEFSTANLQKRSRPDMEWVWTLIKNKYDKNLQDTNLTIRCNRLIQFNGDRITLN